MADRPGWTGKAGHQARCRGTRKDLSAKVRTHGYPCSEKDGERKDGMHSEAGRESHAVPGRQWTAKSGTGGLPEWGSGDSAYAREAGESVL